MDNQQPKETSLNSHQRIDVQVIIDTREDQLYNLVDTTQHPYISKEQLELGDILFRNCGKPIIMIERKEINDLASSLHDGRYHEQKSRLKAAKLGGIHILYMIEGSYDQVNHKYNPKFTEEVHRGVIINTMVRDEIPVITTSDITESFNIILDLYKRIPKYIKENAFSEEGGQYVDSIDMCKKNNNKPDVCYINQLRQFPGVSVGIAKQIADKYPNISKLINALEIEGIEAISEIKVNERRIGKVIAHRIATYLGVTII